jgi:hypothetical protein
VDESLRGSDVPQDCRPGVEGDFWLLIRKVEVLCIGSRVVVVEGYNRNSIYRYLAYRSLQPYHS